MEEAVRRIEQAEERVRELLMLTCRDDSYGTQVDLREALEALQELRAELGLHVSEGAHA